MEGMELVVKVQGIPTHYAVAGTKEPVVIVPGWALSPRAFRKVIALLSDDFRVYCLSLPGFGKTPGPDTAWNLPRFQSFLRAFIKKLGIRKPVLIGHSFGGAVCAGVARDKALVRKLVLVDAAGIPVVRTDREWLSRVMLVAKQIRKEGASRQFLYDVFPDYLEYIIKNLKNPHAYGVIMKFVMTDQSTVYSAVKVPTLVLWAKDDLIMPVSNGRKIHQLVRNSKLSLVAGDHEWPLLRPDSFVRKVNRFLLTKRYK